MKKLEDFETSLLDEYDVGCLDTLLQVRALHLGRFVRSIPTDCDNDCLSSN